MAFPKPGIIRKTEAFIDGSWYTIARSRMTYNVTGKRIRTENLAGQVTTTAWDGWSVTYNGENRPILWENVSTNSPTPNSSTPPQISMSYDRMGRRVTKNNQRFVYNGYLQIANFEVVSTNSQLTTYNAQLFIWDSTEPVATRPLVWNHSALNYYTHDGNKNVSEVIAENGDTEAHYEYAPFGAVIAQRGASAAANPWRFSSECTDNTLGIAYYNYRHYEPIVGKWTSRDPLGEKGCLHLYCYLCNETGKTDLLGLLWWPWSKRYCCSVCMYSAIDWDAYKISELLTGKSCPAPAYFKQNND